MSVYLFQHQPVVTFMGMKLLVKGMFTEFTAEPSWASVL